jgi:single-strand DNA-binding protein
MSDLNKWVGSGRVTRDTELRYTPNGTAVADVGMCSNRVWSKDGEKQEQPTFVDITLWGKQAESLTQYLTKGAFIMVEGRLELDMWETDEGKKRSKLKVVAERVNLGPRTNGNSNSRNVATEEKVPF